MRTRTIGSWLVIALLLAACGGAGGPAASKDPDTIDGAVDPTPTLCPEQPEPAETDEDGYPIEDPYGDECELNPGGNGGNGGNGQSIEGEWTGQITHTWSQTIDEVDAEGYLRAKQTYEALVQITSTQTDFHSWELSGQGTVVASWTWEKDGQMDTPLGPCHQHYTDLVPKNVPKAVAVLAGGLGSGAVGDLYDFHVNLEGFELVNHTVRDDTGCFGGRYVEDTPWPVAPMLLSASDTIADPTHLTGTRDTSQSGDDDILTWDLRLN
jgi:hypothetical protein